ncbi:MAG: hypothetical protein NC827_09845 [Candidatus Omnitrophica bacterium]|nr:hypothetical protein [Candidatus Omnitrophota bacterium]
MKVKKKILVFSMIIILALIGTTFIYWLYFIKPGVSAEQKIIEGFIKENLNINYFPKDLKVIQKLTYKNTTDGMENLYGAIWYVDGRKFYGGMHKNINKPGVSNLRIFIFTQEITKKLNEDEATSLFDKYFKVKSGGEVDCHSPTEGVIFCEKFWIEKKGAKKGLFAIHSPGNNFLGMCQYPKESEQYELSSCAKL